MVKNKTHISTLFPEYLIIVSQHVTSFHNLFTMIFTSDKVKYD